MSSKKLTMDNKTKNSQSRKNRRRSTRHTSMNGDSEDSKERLGKRSRDSKEYDIIYENTADIDVYKDILDLVPSVEYDCCPSESPAPPGTRVDLHGVILHETEGGLIVLNVRWRNKVFSGALIDVEKNKWASERILKDQSDAIQAPPPIRKIKIPTSAVTAAGDDSDSGNNRKKGVTSPTTPSKNAKSSRSGGKKRNCQEVTSPVQGEETPSKRNKLKLQNCSESSFECPEPNCGKKYKNKNGLSYHRRTVHETTRKNENTDESGKENKSDDSDSGEDNFVIDEKAEEERGGEEEDEERVEKKNEVNHSEDDKKDELTENEKHIERLKLKTEKALLCIKQENEATEELKKETSESVETLVDVESDVVSTDDKKLDDDMLKVPSIQVESAVPEAEAITSDLKQEDDHPKGSSYTIIHEKDMKSLNELFPPGQKYQQYSPTLSNLNPQILNDSLTDALSKQQKTTKETNATVADVSLKQTSSSDVTSTLTDTVNNEAADDYVVTKQLLEPKPSVEITPCEHSSQEEKPNISIETYSNVLSKDEVDCSDDERSISPENVLIACHKIFPQNDRDVKSSKPNFLSMTGSNIFMNPVFQSVLSQPQKVFENSLLFKELASKVSSAAANINSLQAKLPALQLQDFVQLSNIDPKTFTPNMLSFITSSNVMPTEIPFSVAAPSSEDRNETKACLNMDGGSLDIQLKPSLLEQRLLAQTGKCEATLITTTNSGSNKGYLLQPNISAGIPLSRQLSQKLEAPLPVTHEKVVSSSFIINRDRKEEKPVAPPSSLRINPPIASEERVQMGVRTWFPTEVVKEGQFMSKEYLGSQANSSSSFRLPLTRTSPANNLHVYTPNLPASDRNSKVLKRPAQPIPIAPAPTSILQVPTPMMPLPTPAEYTSPESDKEQPQMGRFTLTSDNRLIPSPAENRGRPRKVRVEKTHQVPIGTAQEIARSRGPADSVLIRKHSAVVRASVIQGSTNFDETGMGKINERNSADVHSLFQHPIIHGSSMDDRFTTLRQENMSKEARSGTEKYKEYKGISSPPMGYFPSPQSRSILSPPRGSGDGLPRSSPGISHELLSKTHYHQLALDHHRGMSDVLRLSEPSRRTPLSPREAMQPFIRSPETDGDHRLVDYRYQPLGGMRTEVPARNEHQRVMFERRTPTEESERMRERYIQQQSSQSIRRSPHTPPHSSAQSGHHSTNLVLGRADGAIIGPLSMYEFSGEHKR